MLIQFRKLLLKYEKSLYEFIIVVENLKVGII